MKNKKTALLAKRIPSPARLLSVIDPLLGTGVLLQVLLSFGFEHNHNFFKKTPFNCQISACIVTRGARGVRRIYESCSMQVSLSFSPTTLSLFLSPLSISLSETFSPTFFSRDFISDEMLRSFPLSNLSLGSSTLFWMTVYFLHHI